MKKCPLCAEDIQDAAIKCRYCGSQMTAAEARIGSVQPKAEAERTIYDKGLHWAVFFRPIMWAVLALFFGAMPELSAFFILVTVVEFAARWVMQTNTQFRVTTRRLSLSTGIVKKRSLELVLPKVESIIVNEPLLGRVLGYGTVVVGGAGGTKEAFSLVPRPHEFRDQVQAQLAVAQVSR